MEHYRILNKELIDEVQKKRSESAALEKEIVYLNERVLEERTARVELQHKMICLLTCNYREIVQTINPDLNIPLLLSETQKNSLGVSVGTYERKTVSSNVEAEEQCVDINNITASPDNRRSAGNIGRRSSLCTVSPTRRKSHKSPINENEEQQYEENNDVEEIALNRSENLYDINEDEEQEASVEEDLEEEELQSEVEVETVVVVHQRATPKKTKNAQKAHSSLSSPLRDVTNKQHTNLAKKAKEFADERSPRITRVMLQRGKGAKTANSIDSIEAVRHATSFEKTLTPLKIPESYDISKERDTSSIISAMSDLTIKNFAHVPTSTPNSSKIEHQNMSKTMSNNETHSLRPRRQCTPTQLAEPSLRDKLRNENNCKKGRKNKQK